MKVKAKLTLTVEYEGEDATPKLCAAQLEELVRFASSRGLLSGDFDMVVEEFDYSVSTIPPQFGFSVELEDGGCIEWPDEDGTIRRRDIHGNCGGDSSRR